jgi:hypothetical protein
VDKSNIEGPPTASAPVMKQVRKGIVSGSWTSGDKTYILAALGDETFLKRYLPLEL